ncbi:MAG: cupredoxin domain-containing protein [Acidimicrobiales bacterium]
MAGIVLAAAVVFGLTAGVGAIWSAVTRGPSVSLAASSAPVASAPAAVQVKLAVDPPPLGGVKGSNGIVDEAYVPGTFTMQAGTTYDVTVLNYSTQGHTWTAPSLNVNAVVPVGSPSSPSVTHFTITPKKAGTYQWFCAVPCDKWSMAHNGFMRGFVVVKA